VHSENLRIKISQGDIFANVPLIDSAKPSDPPKDYNVIILSHTCDIDKPTQKQVLVCVVKSFSVLKPGQDGDVRKDRVRNVMYLRTIKNLGEVFVDFRCEFRLNKEVLSEGDKIISLTDQGQLALAHYFYRFLVRDVES